jgi:hypothetical protein
MRGALQAAQARIEKIQFGRDGKPSGTAPSTRLIASGGRDHPQPSLDASARTRPAVRQPARVPPDSARAALRGDALMPRSAGGKSSGPAGDAACGLFHVDRERALRVGLAVDASTFIR